VTSAASWTIFFIWPWLDAPVFALANCSGRLIEPPFIWQAPNRGIISSLYLVALNRALFGAVILNGAKRSEESRFFASLRMTILLFYRNSVLVIVHSKATPKPSRYSTRPSRHGGTIRILIKKITSSLKQIQKNGTKLEV
jgi:hypothetical protein